MQNPRRKSTFGHLGVQDRRKKVGIQAPGPPRRDPGRNSVSDPGFKVSNGGMATHLVAKRCDLGSLGVPGPASTPEPPHFEPPHLSCISPWGLQGGSRGPKSTKGGISIFTLSG